MAEPERVVRKRPPSHAQFMMARFVETLVNNDASLLGWADMDRVVDRFERTVSGFPGHFAALYWVCFYLFVYLAFPFAAKLRPFHRLAFPERLRYMMSWERGRLAITRNLFQFLKIPAIVSLVREPEVFARIGYMSALDHRLGRPRSTDAAVSCEKGAGL